MEMWVAAGARPLPIPWMTRLTHVPSRPPADRTVLVKPLFDKAKEGRIAPHHLLQRQHLRRVASVLSLAVGFLHISVLISPTSPRAPDTPCHSVSSPVKRKGSRARRCVFSNIEVDFSTPEYMVAGSSFSHPHSSGKEEENTTS